MHLNLWFDDCFLIHLVTIEPNVVNMSVVSSSVFGLRCQVIPGCHCFCFYFYFRWSIHTESTPDWFSIPFDGFSDVALTHFPLPEPLQQIKAASKPAAFRSNLVFFHLYVFHYCEKRFQLDWLEKVLSHLALSTDSNRSRWRSQCSIRDQLSFQRRDCSVLRLMCQFAVDRIV